MYDSKRYKEGLFLARVIGKNAKDYFPNECRRLVYDWRILCDLVQATEEETSFYDYCFVITPIGKAVEGVLLKIADDLDITIDGSDKLGTFFSEENVKNNFEKIEKRIKDELKSVGGVEEIMHQLSELRTFLKRYRHVPAHFGEVYASLEKSQAAGTSALHNLGELVNDLLEAGVIDNSPDSDDSESEEINLDDIPF